MSDEGSLTLDHVGLISPDLDAAREDYEKLGFLLTRESSHQRKLSPEGTVEPLGSGNRCAMFRQGYYEILGITDPHRPLDHFRALAGHFHGIAIIALGCERADDLYRAKKDRVSGLNPPLEIGRDVPLGVEGDATKPALFRIVHVPSEAFPEAEVLFVEHATPEVLWQKGLLDHPNGVEALSGVTLCSEDPESTARRFERLTGRPRSDRGLRFDLDEGFVEIGAPGEVTSRYPGVVLPAVPCVAAVTLAVRDLEETRAHLKASGITPHPASDGLWVRPERTGGVVLHFSEGGRA